jgi:hypothetical protein
VPRGGQGLVLVSVLRAVVVVSRPSGVRLGRNDDDDTAGPPGAPPTPTAWVGGPINHKMWWAARRRRNRRRGRNPHYRPMGLPMKPPSDPQGCPQPSATRATGWRPRCERNRGPARRRSSSRAGRGERARRRPSRSVRAVESGAVAVGPPVVPNRGLAAHAAGSSKQHGEISSRVAPVGLAGKSERRGPILEPGSRPRRRVPIRNRCELGGPHRRPAHRASTGTCTHHGGWLKMVGRSRCRLGAP